MCYTCADIKEWPCIKNTKGGIKGGNYQVHAHVNYVISTHYAP